MKFNSGDQILAKQTSSSDYSKGKIVAVKGDQYTVQFQGGVLQNISASDIKAMRTSRSVTRTSSRSNRKSPSRYSPGRKSPSRRSPARSPGNRSKRATRTEPRNARLAKISIPRIEIPKADDTSESGKTDTTKISSQNDDSSEVLPLHLRLRDIGPVTRRTTRLFSSTIQSESDKFSILNRNIDRAVSLPVERKALDLPLGEKEQRGLSMQREQYEDNSAVKSASNKRLKEIDLVSKPQEWGGWIGALFLIISTPVMVILPQIACTYNQCNVWNMRIPTNWKTYFELEAFLLYTGFILFLAIISALPIGRRIDGQQSRTGTLQYRMNGIIAAVLILSALSFSVYKDFKVIDYILNKSVALAVAGWILGAMFATMLYIKGGRAPVSNLNIYGSTHNAIYDFWQGREINPRIGPLDFKFLLFRAGVIGLIIINAAELIKEITDTKHLSIEHLNLSLVVAASLQIFYALDFLIFEAGFVTSFEIQYEGTGYMLAVGYLMYPFIPSVVTRFLLKNRLGHSNYFLVPLVIIFFAGYILCRASNSQKDAFRKNPITPNLYDTIPTQRGKRLIVSGLWGYVRHPNYLGDIIMHWAISSICLTTNILPYYPAIFCTLFLMYRAIRDNARCNKRYGYAWEQYCSRVKYMILRHVF